jgi:predicted nuclease of predicted toxin-antitoxin system
MRLYLDDDTASQLLAKLLRNAGHDVQMPNDAGMAGSPDPVHLTAAIADNRICLTKNHDDFWTLHKLIKQARGGHPGIIVVRQDNDPTRDLTPKGIVGAIRRLESAGVPIADEFVILNHWR